jgi:formyltetrahydrofolate hydrolase
MVITIQCKNQYGLLATITNVFKKEDCNIISMREYNDIVNDLCFVRIEAEHFNDVNMLE